MRFKARHPDDQTMLIHYGFDPALGFFVEMDLDGPLVEYDRLQRDYDHQRPLLGALHFLVNIGYFSENVLEEALLHLERVGRDAPPPRRLRRAIEVVRNFKKAAD